MRIVALFHTHTHVSSVIDFSSVATWRFQLHVVLTHMGVHTLPVDNCAEVCIEHLGGHNQRHIVDEHQRRLFTERLYIQLATLEIFSDLHHVSEE